MKSLSRHLQFLSRFFHIALTLKHLIEDLELKKDTYSSTNQLIFVRYTLYNMQIPQLFKLHQLHLLPCLFQRSVRV